MDIAAASIGMHQATLQNAVQLSVMKMTMDNSNVLNNQMTEMIDNMAVDTNLGSNLDATV